MITPKFECTQTNDFVIVTILIPHVKMTEMEYSIDNNSEDDEAYIHTKSVFRFYVKPYFLRLHFAQLLNEDGTQDFSKYDAENEKLFVHLPKKNPGEFFENLNMITWLLGSRTQNAPTVVDLNHGSESDQSSKKKVAPLIEVVESTTNDEDDEENGMVDEQAKELDWKQQLPEEQVNIEAMAQELGIAKVYYGFNKQFSGTFATFSQEYINEIIDVPENPELLPPDERRKLRLLEEMEVFDPEHYLVDYINKDRDIKFVFDFTPQWCLPTSAFAWSEKEQQMLAELPKKEFLINNEILLYYGLVDLLCSYAYNHRTFVGESNVESPWTICKMSSQLSWLEDLTNLKESLEFFISRTCVYALYRNFDLAIQCIRDVAQLLSKGKEFVLRALLDLKDILAHTHDKYLLNKLYVDNYCIWIQGTSNETLQKLADTMMKIVEEEFLAKRDEFLISDAISLKKLEDYALECIANANSVDDLVMTDQDRQKPLALSKD